MLNENTLKSVFESKSKLFYVVSLPLEIPYQLPGLFRANNGGDLVDERSYFDRVIVNLIFILTSFKVMSPCLNTLKGKFELEVISRFRNSEVSR